MKLDQALIRASLNMKNCFKRRKNFDDTSLENFKSSKVWCYKTAFKKRRHKHDEWMKAIE